MTTKLFSKSEKFSCYISIQIYTDKTSWDPWEKGSVLGCTQQCVGPSYKPVGHLQDLWLHSKEKSGMADLLRPK